MFIYSELRPGGSQTVTRTDGRTTDIKRQACSWNRRATRPWPMQAITAGSTMHIRDSDSASSKTAAWVLSETCPVAAPRSLLDDESSFTIVSTAARPAPDLKLLFVAYCMVCTACCACNAGSECNLSTGRHRWPASGRTACCGLCHRHCERRGANRHGPKHAGSRAKVALAASPSFAVPVSRAPAIPNCPLS